MIYLPIEASQHDRSDTTCREWRSGKGVCTRMDPWRVQLWVILIFINYTALWRLLDVLHPLIIPKIYLVPSYMHKGATFMYPMYDLDGSIKP